MKTSKFWNQLSLFVLILISTLLLREYITFLLLENNIDSYQIHTSLGITINLVLIFISYVFIKKNELLKIAGIKETKLANWKLLLFPLYLAILNALTMDDINTDYLIPNIAILLVYCVSIGFAEELSLRGFIQSMFIKHFGKTKRNVVISIFVSAFIFGVLHFLNFNKGLYGEIMQVLFATFIGVMFGVLLIITKRIYPLIIIHAIIDFVAKIDSMGIPVKEKISATSLESAIIITFLTLPCLIYAIILMKKHPLISNT